MIIACQGDISKEYQQDLLTIEDVVPIVQFGLSIRIYDRGAGDSGRNYYGGG
jgi:hypothetical protein